MPRTARDVVLQDHMAGDVPITERKWYYRIEYAPGAWTDGRVLQNVHLTREALRRAQVDGLQCLDIGCMEGLVSVLLARRGASVTAYDRLNFSERIAFLKQALGVNFDYMTGFPLNELPAKLPNRTFDVVIFSGVLYHMFDVLGGLLAARRYVHNGGLMFVETAVVISSEMSAQFNGNRRFYPGDNFWFLSTTLLDYLLRFCRLRPLDAFYFHQKPFGGGPELLARLCIPCLAVEAPPAADEDLWLREPQTKDFVEYIDWTLLQRNARVPINYDTTGRNLIRRKDGSVMVHETVLATPETLPKDKQRQVGLPLGAIY